MPSETTDEELIEALADLVTLDDYGPGANDCAARAIVERIGGDELRALGWTPEIMQTAGFSPFHDLDANQLDVMQHAWVDCVDVVDLALQSVPVDAEEVDPTCLAAALEPEPKQAVLRSFPTNTDYDAGLGVANAVLDCLDPVDFVTALWSPVAPRYSGETTTWGVEGSIADRTCIADWLGDDQRRTAVTVFELIQIYRWADDPNPLIEQLESLNQQMTTGEIPTHRLDQLDSCFARPAPTP